MTKAFAKNIWRSITGSIGRYVAILLIVFLGVGFFSGLKMTKQSMLAVESEYIREHRLYDLRLLSTIGFDESDVEAAAAIPGTEDAEGSVFQDFILRYDGDEVVLRAHMITDGVNTPVLIEGRLPEADNEILVSADYFKTSDILGQTLSLREGNTEDTLSHFKYDEYTVVGRARSVLYMSRAADSTTLGNGSLSGFVMIPEGGFDFDYYTELYIKTTDELEPYSDAYNDYMDLFADRADTIEAEVLNDRYDDLVSDAEDEIRDAEDTLASETADAEAELADAKTQLEDAEKDLKSALIRLQQGEIDLADGEAALESAKKQLDAAAAAILPGASWTKALAAGQEQLAAGQAQLDEAVAAGQAQLDATKAQLDAGEIAYSQKAEELSAAQSAYESQLAAYEAAAAQLDAGRSSMTDDEIAAAETSLAETKAALDGEKQELDAAQTELAATRTSLDEGWAAHEAGVQQLEQTRSEQQAQLDALSAQLTQFAAGIESYNSGKAQLDEARSTLQYGWSQYESGLQEYQDGVQEYEDGQRELEEGVADAQSEIDDAKEELADLEEPELYVLKRSESCSGYITFDSDSDIVGNVAKIFPLFFFLVAALICSTTMTRMVDDDRTQIGTMRALGYSRRRIISKYMIYSGSAALIGTVGGYFLGGYFFPKVIWIAYQMLYSIDGYVCVFQWPIFVISLAAALLCSMGTTYLALMQMMKDTPADLIRPAAPKPGKRVLLERVTFLWSRLKFLHKVTVRNIFRFKKRMFMMLLGIAGCTALLLTGMGIRDSVANIGDYQFGEIHVYDINVTSDGAVSEDLLAAARDPESGVESFASALFTSADISANRVTKSVNLVASDDEAITEEIHFFKGDTAAAYPGEGQVLLTDKLAGQLGVSVGDTVSISISDTQAAEATVSGIVENYVYNYIYMTGETYTELFDTGFEPKNLLISVNEGTDPHVISTAFANRDDVTNVSVIQDTRDYVDKMMTSLNYVVMLVVGCAAALAFIVMFNLGNINISERVREIATIKVLGFHRRETSAYVFRENIILAMMGTICGLPLGILLHRFVMSQITVDMVSFKIVLSLQSFLLSAALVLLFALITDLILRRKIDRIDMAESLKSIE